MMGGFPLYQSDYERPPARGDGSTTRERASQPSLAEMSRRLLMPPPPGNQQRKLRSMVETEIIPRLMLAHRAQPFSPMVAESSNDDAKLGAAMTEAFTQILMKGEGEQADRFIEGLLQQGLDVEAIFMDLIAPAARLLGDYWLDDRASFMDVTVGLGKLQQVVRSLGYNPSQGYGDCTQSRSILLASCPGEQHTLGLFLIEELFSRSGWRCCTEPSAEEVDLEDIVASQWFDVIGLTLSSEDGCEATTSFIKGLKLASLNRSVFVIIGGLALVENPQLAAIVGADATASNGAEALNVIDNALNRHMLSR
jgi:methanogenic corrinoid protein MtbC1